MIESNLPASTKPNVILSFFQRHWGLLIIFAVAAFVAVNDWLFKQLGTLIYVPVLCMAAALCALMVRHILNRHTTSQDAHDGTFDRNWDSLEPKIKVILHVVQFLVYFYVCGHIAAAVMGK